MMARAPAPKNHLYFGDNLDILRAQIPDDSADLIYLDPPFNSNASYNVLFKERSGERSAAQITAFEDTWHWSLEAEPAYHEAVKAGGKLAELLSALRSFLGQNDMMAYLVMIGIRLTELRRVLKPTGSIYLHCDPTASHYIKLLLDATFGPDRFKTEIIWKRSSAHSDGKQGRKQHGRIHDVIFFYTMAQNHTWNTIYGPYEEDYVQQFYRHAEPETGRRYMLDNLTGPGGAAKGNPSYEMLGVTRYWRYTEEKMQELIAEGRIVQTGHGTVPRYKRYLDEMPGVPLQDLWTDVPPIGSHASERLGYPTQKPELLLERIITASSDEGDVILDPFCGCGTAIAVAEKLHRRWIGIDITHIAITLVKHRIQSMFDSELSPFEIIGVPSDVSSARALAKQDRHQFEWWALGLVDARPDELRKGADRGVDGAIYFLDDTSGKTKRVLVQVKSGKVGVSPIRDLVGVLGRDEAEIGAFITLESPTRPMQTEAAAAGFYIPEKFPSERCARLQILTIEELLLGAKIQYPRLAPAETFKRAKKVSKRKPSRNGELPFS